MINVKEYLNWQILLILFVNIFMANSYFTWIYPLGMLAIKIMFGDGSGLLYIFLAILILTMKFLYLPILYSLLDKYSKNMVVKNFISNMKKRAEYRKKILIVAGMPTLIIAIKYGLNNYHDIFSYMYSFIEAIMGQLCCMDLFGSYLILFLWWKLKGELR